MNKKEEISKYLSDIFVNDYEYFSDVIIRINKIFKKYNINYQYDYNTYCKDYIKKCHEMIDNEPNIDFINTNNYLLYTIVTSSIVDDIRKNININE